MTIGDRVVLVLIICGIFWYNLVAVNTIIYQLDKIIAGQNQIAGFLIVPGKATTGPIKILNKPEPLKDKERNITLKEKVKK